MNRKVLVLFLSFICFGGISALETNAQIPTYIVQSLNIDSIYNNTDMPVIFANDIYIFPSKTFKNKRERRRYNKLRHNFIKVYPYAIIIEEEINEMEKVLDKLPSEEAQKAYIKRKDKELKEQFKEPLMHLTMSQGLLLVKLIDRQTGNTAYILIDELKGSVRAFFWQGIARMFGNNLKSEFDAEGKDKDIEQLIILWEHNCL